MTFSEHVEFQREYRSILFEYPCRIPTFYIFIRFLDFLMLYIQFEFCKVYLTAVAPLSWISMTILLSHLPHSCK